MVNVVDPNPLCASVLVLNRYYMAVHVVHAKRAICLLFRDLAEVIHVEEGQYANYDFGSWLTMCELWSEAKQESQDWVKSVNFEFQIPRVIRLYSYDRTPRQTVRFNRRNLFARDGNRCMYCGDRFPLSQLSLDHVLPKSRGGPTDWENVVASCVSCNVRKGGRTPKEARMKLMQKPVRPKRNPMLNLKLNNPKYASWRAFLAQAPAEAS